MTRRRVLEVLGNTTSNYLREGVEVVTFLLLTPFIHRTLGTEGFGLWSLVWATVGFLALMDLGFSTSVVKYVADARGRDDAARLKAVTATLFWVYALLGSVTAVLAVLVAPALPNLLGVPAEHAQALRWVFLLVSLRVATGMPLGMFSGVLIGFQKQSWANAIRMSEGLLYASGCFLLLGADPRVETLAWLSMSTGLLGQVALVALALKRLSGVSISPANVRLEMVREVSGFSLYFFLIQVSMLLYMRLDAILVQMFLSLSAVALYAVASRTAEKAGAFCRQLTNALTPLVAELNGARRQGELATLFRVGGKVNTALAVPLLSGLLLLADDLLVAWMGPEFAGAALPLRLLTGATLVSVIHAHAANVLSMTGHQRYLAFSFAGAQVFNVIATLLLLPFWGLGGAAAATLISTLVVDVLVVQRRAGKAFGVSLAAFYRMAVLPSVLPALVALSVTWVMAAQLDASTLLTVASLELLNCAVFFGAFFAVGLKSSERSALTAFARRALGSTATESHLQPDTVQV